MKGGNSQFPKKNRRDGLLDGKACGQSTVRIELSAHLSNRAPFRRTFIFLDWVPGAVWTKMLRYIGWEDEGLSVWWLRAFGLFSRIEANPIEPADEDERSERPC